MSLVLLQISEEAYAPRKLQGSPLGVGLPYGLSRVSLVPLSSARAMPLWHDMAGTIAGNGGNLPIQSLLVWHGGTAGAL